MGLPEEKLLTFTVPGGVFPLGGAMQRTDVQELGTTPGAKLYFYVEDLTTAMEVSSEMHHFGLLTSRRASG